MLRRQSKVLDEAATHADADVVKATVAEDTELPGQ